MSWPSKSRDPDPAGDPAEVPCGQPTVHPPFDPTEYARESEQSLRSAKPAAPPAAATPADDGEERGSGVHRAGSMADTEGDEAPGGSAAFGGSFQPGDDVLAQVYESRIGPPDSVPYLHVSPAELCRFPLDPPAAFILSQVDGFSTIEMILDVSGMPPKRTMRILFELAEQGLITFR